MVSTTGHCVIWILLTTARKSASNSLAGCSGHTRRSQTQTLELSTSSFLPCSNSKVTFPIFGCSYAFFGSLVEKNLGTHPNGWSYSPSFSPKIGSITPKLELITIFILSIYFIFISTRTSTLCLPPLSILLSAFEPCVLWSPSNVSFQLDNYSTVNMHK